VKVYIHTGDGHYGMGSVIVVAAYNLPEAKKLVRDELDSFGLKDEKLKVKLVHFKNDNIGRVLLSKSGDY